MGRRKLYESKYKGEQVDAAIDSTLRNVKGRISSSQLDSLNNVGSIGLYNIAGGATNMSHLLVTSASNGWIYQYLFGPFNEGAVSPASSNGRCNTIGVRYYDKTGWSEWKYADLSYMADAKVVIEKLQKETKTVYCTQEEYNALIDEGKLQDDTTYFIYEEE